MTTSNPCSPRQMCRASGSDCLLLDPAGAHFTLGPRQRGYFAARRKFADIPPSPARHTAKRSFVVITSSRQTRRLLRTDYSVPSPRQNAAGAMRNVCDGTSSSCFEVQPPRRERNIGRRRRRSSIAARQAVGERAKLSESAKTRSDQSTSVALYTQCTCNVPLNAVVDTRDLSIMIRCTIRLDPSRDLRNY